MNVEPSKIILLYWISARIAIFHTIHNPVSHFATRICFNAPWPACCWNNICIKMITVSVLFAYRGYWSWVKCITYILHVSWIYHRPSMSVCCSGLACGSFIAIAIIWCSSRCFAIKWRFAGAWTCRTLIWSVSWWTCFCGWTALRTVMIGRTNCFTRRTSAAIISCRTNCTAASVFVISCFAG